MPTADVELRETTGVDIARRGPVRRGHNASDAVDEVLEASRLADKEVPDGGYGWVVVSACAVITWWFIGTSYSWGVIQDALVEQGISSSTTLAYVGSLAIALLSILAVPNARLLRAIGARRTGMVGVTFLGVAEILSSFSFNSVAGLFCTSGFLFGLGISLCFITVSSIPTQYFSRKRGLANGVVFAGGGLGGAITSFAVESLIQRIGLPWTYRILGLMTLLTGLPAAWLIKERVPARPTGLVDWRLFKDLRFLVVFAAGAVATFPLLVPPFFLPLYSRSVGLSSSTGAGLVAGFNFSSAVGRILCGLLCDTLGALNTLFLCLLVNAVSLLLIWPASTALAPLTIFVIVSGAANGGFFSTMPTVVGNVFGSQRLSVAMGMIVTGWAGGYLMGAPVAGYLLDAYGGSDNGLGAYRPAMIYAGSMALGACGFVALARVRISTSIWAKT
ncbi:major facilitator superfamily protein [Hirsutella rhossiliensis]|uniref:Major facilitator superfamily domain-containing protein n=1 Tax=Hirsutella rhossiliensis TaxID=111463 RepID=A0A9P8SJQ3_9HYPO|nr:major facilitator superfamily domain-containing protein [Hirsutella rhossiliensis]KAH0965538.1 major facilitator superfamily domain-containing protein [Hirsutella rhossiliensis]